MRFKMIQVIARLNYHAFFCLKKMMWALVVLVVLFLLLMALLFVPIQLYFNTNTKQYYGRVGHLAKAFLEKDEVEIIRFRVRILRYQFFLYPFKKKKDSKAKRKTKSKSENKKSRLRWIIKLLKAFRLKQFELNVDTGNYITNAKLYPVFALLNYRFAKCRINYQGVNYLVFDIRSRPLTILKTFIHY